MTALLALLLTGCAPQPASIKFDGKPEIVVHAKDAVAVQKATVLDKDGKAIDPQPTLSWSVDPGTVAKYEGGKVTPVGNGDAKVEAKVGEIKNAYTFKVAFPDKIEIAGLTGPITVGGTANLTATVKAGADMVDGQTITWSSSDEAKAKVDASGVVSGIAEGPAKITATSGELKAEIDVTVGGAAVAAADAAAAPAPGAAPAPAADKAAPAAPPAPAAEKAAPAKPVAPPPPGQGAGKNR